MTYTPKLSIIIPTLNNEKLLVDLFKSLESQTYPQDCLEILVVDGGSSDGTLRLAKAAKATIIPNPAVLAEPGVNIGLQRAAGDLMMIMAADNVFKQTDALMKIAAVFEDPTIYAAFPKHDSDETDTVFSRYYNTFTDPFNHFVYQSAANARTFYRTYSTLKRTNTFDVYDFAGSPVQPMLALAQGFTLRAGFVRAAADEMDDCMPVLSLIQERRSIAYVHSVSLYHHTIRSFGHFIRKQRWATKNSLKGEQYGISHRLSRLSPAQKLRAKLWPVYALSLIFPVLRALWGIIRDREKMWLFHPFICLASAAASVYEVLQYVLNKQKNFSRQ